MSDAEPGIESLLDARTLTGYLERQRWFGGKARRISETALLDSIPLSADASSAIAIVEVRFEDGGADRYVLPLRRAAATDVIDLQRDRPNAIATTARSSSEVVFDAIFDDDTCLALVEMIRRRGERVGRVGRLQAENLQSREDGTPGQLQPIRRTAPDQSNTSVIFGSHFIMKLFRRLESGANPDVEIGRFLTERRFSRIPALAGTIEYAAPNRAAGSVVMLQQFVPNEGNAWQLTLRELEAFFSRLTRDQHPDVRDPIAEPRDLSSAIPPVIADTIGSYLVIAETLGRRTGELHVALASADDVPAFAPERFTRADLDRTASAMRKYGEEQLRLLETSLPRIPESRRELAEQVLADPNDLLARFDALRRVIDAGSRTRCHGDYHLGQTLVSDGDVIILDFEGEPARPLEERRAKSSPLRDVAGMLRSFSYAVLTQLDGALKAAPADRERLVAWAHAWEAWVAGRFLFGYFAATDGATFLPRSRAEVDTVLDAFTLEKALYEVGYELNNRPEWVWIPLLGLRRLITAASSADGGVKTGAALQGGGSETPKQ